MAGRRVVSRDYISVESKLTKVLTRNYQYDIKIILPNISVIFIGLSGIGRGPSNLIAKSLVMYALPSCRTHIIKCSIPVKAFSTHFERKHRSPTIARDMNAVVRLHWGEAQIARSAL